VGALQSEPSRPSARPARPAPVGRKERGAYPTPTWLVDLVVAATVTVARPGADVVVVDPACGDGRFLAAAARRVRCLGGRPVLVGVDIDAASLAVAAGALDGEEADLRRADALDHDWPAHVDVVVGNPPYLSQLATATTRGGASRHGGGPYADAAVEFLALAVRMLAPGGRLGLVLPQSILASRDAAGVRAEVDGRAGIVWSWWSDEAVFDAQVRVCAIVAEVGRPVGRRWTDVVTVALDVPAVPPLAVDGSLGSRARLTANFRDQYYGLVPAVVEDGAGPPLVTSGLIDPGRSAWGTRPVTFARTRFARPTVELDRLTPAMRRWADALLVPKVLVANQTKVVEAVVDGGGAWLPGVPALTARPLPGHDPWAIAAVLTSPVASAWARHGAGGAVRAPRPALARGAAVAGRGPVVGRRGVACRRRRRVWSRDDRRLRCRARHRPRRLVDRRTAARRPGSRNIVTPGLMGQAAGPLPESVAMVRGRSGLRALAFGLPVLVAALAACGDDAPSAGGGGDADPAVERGQALARTRGCSACHGADGQGGLGPAWTDLVGSTVTLDDGSTVVADDTYITRSIVDPTAQVVAGFSLAMPKTDLSDAEVADLVAYIDSLSG
jgi:mono/diheme cytochrome c family protein/SAM-dependent methyltransferase